MLTNMWPKRSITNKRPLVVATITHVCMDVPHVSRVMVVCNMLMALGQKSGPHVVTMQIQQTNNSHPITTVGT